MEESLFSVVKTFLKDFVFSKSESELKIPLFTIILAFFASVFFVILIIFLVAKIVAIVKQRKKLESFQVNVLTELMNLQKIPDSEKKLLCNLVKPCVELGFKIDSHTNRPDNFKEVSSLVYKISKCHGNSELNSFVYFLAAMVYDAGFLQIDKSIFRSEILSYEEKKGLKTHVLRGLDYLDFVPSKYMLIFVSGTFLHHENCDGSGYPESLESEEIPELAKMIRIAESYVSLTGRRSYHKIKSSADAYAELKSQNNLYESEFINLLGKVLGFEKNPV